MNRGFVLGRGAGVVCWEVNPGWGAEPGSRAGEPGAGAGCASAPLPWAGCAGHVPGSGITEVPKLSFGSFCCMGSLPKLVCGLFYISVYVSR